MFLPVVLILLVIGVVVMIVRLGFFGAGPQLVGVTSALLSGFYAVDGITEKVRSVQLVTPDQVRLENVEVSRLSDTPSFIRVNAAVTNNAEHHVQRIRIRFVAFDCPPGAEGLPDVDNGAPAPAARETNIVRAASLETVASTIKNCSLVGSATVGREIEVAPGQTKAFAEDIVYEDIPELRGQVLIAYRVMLVTSRTRDDLRVLFKSKATEKAKEQALRSVGGV